MSNIHLILQGKGGVGKSYVSAILAQYLQSKGHTISCFDTDPVNKTFAQFNALKVKKVDLLDKDSHEIDKSRFDKLIIDLLANEDSDAVIDNGASSFIPLSTYLLESDILGMLREAGKQVFIHTLIVGGQGIRDSLNGFKTLVESFGEKAEFVVWLNHFFGKIILNDKTFEEMKVYKNHQEYVSAIMTMTKKTPETFGVDIENMLKARLTFEEVIKSPEFHIISKQRIKMTERELWEQLDAVFPEALMTK